MQDGIVIKVPVDRFGRIRPVADNDYVGSPVIGYTIRMEDGFYAITGRDDCVHRDSLDEAASYIANKWRR